MDNQRGTPAAANGNDAQPSNLRDDPTTIDLSQAEQFLTALDEEFDKFTFQIFSDREEKKLVYPEHKHGTLEQQRYWLESKNRLYGGVFVMVNEGDGRGRSAKNVTKVRAVLADFDVQNQFFETDLPLEPQIVVESSPGKFHSYWLVDDFPLEQFTPTQIAISAQLNTDPTPKDLCRVMRIPGFAHHKSEKPFLTRIHEINAFQPYTTE